MQFVCLALGMERLAAYESSNVRPPHRQLFGLKRGCTKRGCTKSRAKGFPRAGVTKQHSSNAYRSSSTIFVVTLNSLAGVVDPEVHVLVPTEGPNEAEPTVAKALHNTLHALPAEAHKLDVFRLGLGHRTKSGKHNNKKEGARWRLSILMSILHALFSSQASPQEIPLKPMPRCRILK